MTAVVILVTGVTQLSAATQKGKEELKERVKEKKEDAKDRKEDAKDRKEDAKDRKEDAKEKVKDRIKDKPRDKARIYVRPEISARVHAYWNHVSPSRRPFTTAWYRTHTSAWRYSYAVRRPWAPATFSSVARFVGITAPPVVYTYETPPAALTPAQWSALTAAVKVGATETPAAADLMPLGVFSLLPPDASESSSMVQLNISKSGALAGSYYDVLSDAGQPIAGSLDRSSQRVAWSIGANQDVVFETGLENLTSEEAPLLVHLKDGTTQKWSMIRNADESVADAAK